MFAYDIIHALGANNKKTKKLALQICEHPINFPELDKKYFF